MKKIILFPFIIFTLALGLRADEGCGKDSDACKPQIKKMTPFMAELKKAQTVPALKQGLIKEPALKQGGPKARLAAAAATTAAIAPATTTIAAAVPAAPLDDKKTVSHPAWLLAAAGLLAGLYYFLRESKKKGKGR